MNENNEKKPETKTGAGENHASGTRSESAPPVSGSAPCSAALLILRVVLGVIFAAHGAQKLFGAFGGPGVAGFGKSLADMGFFIPGLLAWVVSIVEFGGGLLLIAGILPRLSAALIGVIMLVAIFKVHWANGFFNMNQGYEYQLLILTVCLAIVTAGAGRYSVFNCGKQ